MDELKHLSRGLPAVYMAAALLAVLWIYSIKQKTFRLYPFSLIPRLGAFTTATYPEDSLRD